VAVFVGGVIPQQDYEFLKSAGVVGIFGPGTPVPVAARGVLTAIQKRLTLVSGHHPT
jgi:methylmalonyl-CoA mutase